MKRDCQSYSIQLIRKAGIVIVGLVIFQRSTAQDLRVKQLQQQLKQHPQADTFRVNRLNDLAQVSSIPAGSVEAFSISKRINYAKGECEALVNIAFAKSQQGDKTQAFAILQQALAKVQKIGDPALVIRVLNGMGTAKNQTSANKEALDYYLKAEALAEKTPDKKLLSDCQAFVASVYQTSFTDYPKAMEWILKSVKTAEDNNCLDCLASDWATEAGIYTSLGDQANALLYYKKAFDANKQLGNKSIQITLFNSIGERYRLMGNYPEAIKVYNQALADNTDPYNGELGESNLADVYLRMGNLPMAFKYAFSSLKTAKEIKDIEGVAWISGILGRAYLKLNKPDSALLYAKQGLESAAQTGTIEFMRDNCGVLANVYAQKKDFANAYRYQHLYFAYRDSMINTRVSNQSTLMQYNYNLQKKQAQIAALNQEKKLQYSFLIGALVLLAFIALMVAVLFRNNRRKQKANNLLNKQKKIIEEQRDQTNKAMAELKSAQTQLIQSEKMASLGELTAGIAHEIQNPLNFVNNFSEVNTELLDEMQQEIEKGDLKEVKAIAIDIQQNEKKINQHGKRADAIVKGMLQHSKTSSGQKGPTNINTLAEEFMRLAYHGLKSKDESFSAENVTDFDPGLPQINVIPQDIGRVMLNLFNNAFYAVNQKQKRAGDDYKPSVTVVTSAGNGFIELSVKDNGNGVPNAIKDKIMQPFFTTKPTGEGTGLGLSLSYDIVVKGHGGSIDINSVEGEGAEFVITLPAG